MTYYRFLIPHLVWLGWLLCPLWGLHAQELPHGFPRTDKQKLALLNDWEFFLDGPQDGFLERAPQDADWEEVSLPHSLELASTSLNDSPDDEYQLSFHRGIGWYKRQINPSLKPGQKVFLEFEGAHQVTKLWVNGKYVGEHAVGGYTPFHFDLTEFIDGQRTQQELVLSVDNRRNPNIPPEGDRYDYVKWGGLYREVYLVVTDPLRITFPWENTFAGVYLTTPTVTPQHATLSIRTQVINESTQSVAAKVVQRVMDAQGRVLLNLTQERNILPGQKEVFAQTGGLTGDLNLWSPASPYLYRVNTTVYREGKPVD
ncbi:MAG: sugar-binding domain-containing protein, partial [Bacteroidota bacterium]